MTITTEEAERLAATYVSGARSIVATALRSLAAERDALRAERDDLAKRLKDAERERNHQHGRADRNAKLHAIEQKKREQLQAENARLREALQSVLNACDQGRMLERGAGGMTIDAQIRRSFYYGVPAWPIEEARAALGGEGNE
jgi:septal ring factor EnvC (AmiA/AmiB activator)